MKIFLIVLGTIWEQYFKQNREGTCMKRYAEVLKFSKENVVFLMFSELFENIPNVKPVGERS
jgi:hypothetical protein